MAPTATDEIDARPDDGRVTPRLSRGLRDLMPEEMAARHWMIETIRGVYESYGFMPLGTPAVEYRDVLTGSAGEEAQQTTFAASNPEGEELGLRFDLTVPLARVVAQYPDLPRPFRRYQVAPVWRADKPGRGRYREFTQFDIDAVGVESEVADLEIVTAMCDTLEALGVGPYRVRYSSRRVLNLLMPFAGVDPARAVDVFRVLDKLDKIGPEKVRLELTRGYTDESGDRIPGVGLDDANVDRIERFLAIRDDDRDAVLDELRRTLADVEGASAEIDVVAAISRRLDRLGYGSDRVGIDLSVARGLAYYTGPVFEASLLDAPEFGSVFGGGRYDDLVMRFLGERVPATGASIGVDRLLAALLELGRVPTRLATADVLVTAIDPDLLEAYVDLAYELRRAGIRAELYLGGEKRFGKQIRYADRQRHAIALIIGSDEQAKGVVTVKDMAQGRVKTEAIADREAWLAERPGQFEVPRGEVVAAVRGLLEKIAKDEHG